MKDQKEVLREKAPSLSEQNDRMIMATRQMTAAQLANAIIVSSGRAHDLDDALRVFNDVWFLLFPQSAQDNFEHFPPTRKKR